MLSILLGAVMLLPVTGAAAQDEWAAAPTVTVQLSSFRFDPATVTLDHGGRYRLHLVNASSGGHDFSAEDFFAKAQVAPEDRAKISGGRVAVDGGQSVDIRIVAPAAGSYKLHCTHFLHSAFGMKGTIVVR